MTYNAIHMLVTLRYKILPLFCFTELKTHLSSGQLIHTVHVVAHRHLTVTVYRVSY